MGEKVVAGVVGRCAEWLDEGDLDVQGHYSPRGLTSQPGLPALLTIEVRPAASSDA